MASPAASSSPALKGMLAWVATTLDFKLESNDDPSVLKVLGRYTEACLSALPGNDADTEEDMSVAAAAVRSMLHRVQRVIFSKAVQLLLDKPEEQS